MGGVRTGRGTGDRRLLPTLTRILTLTLTITLPLHRYRSPLTAHLSPFTLALTFHPRPNPNPNPNPHQVIVDYFHMTIPPLPGGPLSVRTFHLQV